MVEEPRWVPGDRREALLEGAFAMMASFQFFQISFFTMIASF